MQLFFFSAEVIIQTPSCSLVSHLTTRHVSNDTALETLYSLKESGDRQLSCSMMRCWASVFRNDTALRSLQLITANNFKLELRRRPDDEDLLALPAVTHANLTGFSTLFVPHVSMATQHYPDLVVSRVADYSTSQPMQLIVMSTALAISSKVSSAVGNQAGKVRSPNRHGSLPRKPVLSMQYDADVWASDLSLAMRPASATADDVSFVIIDLLASVIYADWKLVIRSVDGHAPKLMLRDELPSLFNALVRDAVLVRLESTVDKVPLHIYTISSYPFLNDSTVRQQYDRQMITTNIP